MIVDDLNVMSIAGTPMEANPPLIVDPDAMLASAGALQFLQPVARRNAQKVERCRSIDLQQLSMRNPLDVGWKTPAMLAPKELLRLSVRKALDHLPGVRPTFR